ncbi:MAG TPA: glycerophosphodiester phosphodiesterase family protein, partial [Thermomicrobiales bacterium]|nr:glycerophosphodiester phosphodiesterase family protein [Thermomicrobiales bacterium]
PVVIHDHTLERTTNGSGAVNGYTVAELQQFDAGQGEKIPTLAEVFALVGDRIPFFLELKTLDAVPATVELIGRNPQIRWTALSGFPAALDALRVAFPDGDLRLGTFGSRTAAEKLADRLKDSNYPISQAFLDRLRNDAASFDIETVFARAAEIRASKLGVYHEGVDAELVEKVHARGLQIGAWTVNDPVEAKRLMEIGVDSVTTDDPAAILAMIAATRETPVA